MSGSSSIPPLPAPYSLRWRAGVGIPDGGHPDLYQWPAPRPGWYLNWHYGTLLFPELSEGAVPTSVPPPLDTPGRPDYLELDIRIPDDVAAGMYYVPMVYDLEVVTGTLISLVDVMPGRTWLVGNEPDVRWQGNRTPESYARVYHRIYHLIKDADPQAQIAIGGISQVTPLRLAYLDRVLETYQQEFGVPMPVDVWNIHTFILQEKRDDWGVDIPPGFDTVDEGTLWSIDDHGDLSLVEQQIRTMRAWMRSRGEHDKPLWITEYGILMPAEFGFEPETVAEFMIASFDLFQTLTDPDVGWAEDEYRLVQRWVWFSTGYDSYPTGNLFDPRGQPTLLMQAYSHYLAQEENRAQRP